MSGRKRLSLVRLMRPHAGKVICYVLLVACAAFAYVAQYRMLAYSIDSIVDMNFRHIYLVATLICGIVAATITWMYKKVVVGISTSIQAELRKNSVMYMIDGAVEHAEDEANGVLHAVSSNVDEICRYIEWCLETFLPAAASGIATIVYVASFSMHLTLYSCLGFPVVMLLVHIVANTLKKVLTEYQEKLSRHELSISNKIAFYEEYAAQGLTGIAREELLSEHRVLAKQRLRTTVLGSLIWLLQNTQTYYFIFIIFFVGGRLLLAERITIGLLTSFFVNSDSIKSLLNSLLELLAYRKRVSVSFERVSKIATRRESENTEAEHAVMSMNISVNNICYTIEDRMILNDICFRVAGPQLVCIVGKNGSGKSTLLKILAGLYSADTGSYSIGGVQANKKIIKANVGMVAQFPYLFRVPLIRNMQYASRKQDECSVGMAVAAAECVGAVPIVEAHGGWMAVPEGGSSTFSGGELRKLSIAQGILSDPTSLLLDEPLSSLDHSSKSQVKSFILNQCKSKNVFVVTHDMELCEAADFILVLDDGKLVAQGKHHELSECCEIYRELTKLVM